MNGFIKFSLNNWHAIIVGVLTIVLVGVLCALAVPIDILPVNRSPGVQVLTFYSGMPASMVEKALSIRVERWTGGAAGTLRQESRSVTGCSIVRSYFRDDLDSNSAPLPQVMSLAT